MNRNTIASGLVVVAIVYMIISLHNQSFSPVVMGLLMFVVAGLLKRKPKQTPR